MSPEERIACLEAELAAERASRQRLEKALADACAALAGRAPQQDSAWPRRRIQPKPGALAWARANPGVPMPEPAPPGVEIPPAPVEAIEDELHLEFRPEYHGPVRLLTPEERARKAEERTRAAAREAEMEAQRRSQDEERMRLRMRRWVYFIQEGEDGPIKIGCTKGLQGRLDQLQTGHARKLHLRASFEGGREQERELHARFAEHRLQGEWFMPAPALLSHIAALNGRKE